MTGAAAHAGEPPDGWWIDEDLLDVYQTLEVARKKIADVHGPADECCPNKGTKDEDWAPALAGKNFAVVTHDKKIVKRPREKQAIIDAGLGVFIVTWGKPLKRFDRTRLVMVRWDVFEQEYRETPRPFITRVSRTSVTHVDLDG